MDEMKSTMTQRDTTNKEGEELRVRCPKCGRRGRWLAGAFGPFCSERCKLIDMGAWFTEDYRISEPLRPDHFAGDDDLIIDSESS